MSAILEVPVLTMDAETGNETSPDTQNPGQGLSFSPTTSGETNGFFPGGSLRDPSAIPGPRGSLVDFPLPRDASLGAAPPEGHASASVHTWPSLEDGIPQSPGAALVAEFDVLYYKYERRVYRQCFRMLRNQEDAEDLSQEVFLQLYRKAHTFRGEANFSTWLHRLTVNTVLMRLRRHRRWREAITSLDAAPSSEDGANDVLTKASALHAPTTSRVDKISLDVAIARLSSGYKEIFLLHDLEGYRHDEIAKLLGISEGTSKSQLHKARLRLRELMGSAGGRSAGSRGARLVGNKRKSRCHCPRGAE